MTQEAFKLALEALELVNIEFVCNGAHHAKKDRHSLDEDCPVTLRFRAAISAIEEALAQPEQEPVAWKETDEVECPVCKDKGFPWPKCGHITYLEPTPPQRTERPVDCERCNRLEEQAYDLVGKLRVANIKLSMQPQRTWVGLTDEKICLIAHNTDPNDWDDLTFKKCWHEGFKAGFREAEIEHNIKG